MSDAVSDNLKVERSEREARKFETWFHNCGCACEILWEVGHPLKVSYGTGFYKRVLKLYPEKDKEVLEFLLKRL